jgi:hypothetical protein
MMRNWIQKHRKAVTISVGIITILWLFNWLLLGISLDFFAKERLFSAKTAWESQNIRDYRMIIEFSGGFTMRTQYQVTVHDNKVIEAAGKGMVDWRDLNYDPTNVPFSPMDVENADRFTIDNLFQFASNTVSGDTFFHVNNACHRYEADFDPKMSYINVYSNWCDGSVLGCNMGECAFTYRVIELEPLTADTP